jgi:hypothetical protein
LVGVLGVVRILTDVLDAGVLGSLLVTVAVLLGPCVGERSVRLGVAR